MNRPKALLLSAGSKLKAVVAAPVNKLVEIVNTIIDTLIKGLGADAAVAAAIGQAPILAFPVLKWLLQQFVDAIAERISTAVKDIVDVTIIAAQDAVKRILYDQAMKDLKSVISNPGVTNAQKAVAVQNAKDAIDAIVRRGGAVTVGVPGQGSNP